MKEAEMKLTSPLNRIAILRALQLGDLLCAVPAFRALRAAFPKAVISLVGLPWSSTFVERFNHYLDDFIAFPGYPGLPETTPQIRQIPAFLQEMQGLQLDLILQMQGSGSIVNPLVMQFDGRQTTGYYLPGEYCPDEHLFMEYPNHGSEVRRMLHLMEHLGLPSQGEDLEFPLIPEDYHELHNLESKYGFQAAASAVIHVGARAADRLWPVERFAIVADGLAQRGLQVVLTGTEHEVALTREVQTRMKAQAVDLAGCTTLGGVAALVSSSRLLVSNDTGLSHLAAALRVPSVVLFLASEADRWAPADRRLHKIITQARMAQPEDVLYKVDQALQEEQVYAL